MIIKITERIQSSQPICNVHVQSYHYPTLLFIRQAILSNLESRKPATGKTKIELMSRLNSKQRIYWILISTVIKDQLSKVVSHVQDQQQSLIHIQDCITDLYSKRAKVYSESQFLNLSTLINSIIETEQKLVKYYKRNRKYVDSQFTY